MEYLIGRQFKRNVYGPSLWTDTVEDVKVRFIVKEPLEEYKGYQYAEFLIKGKNGGHWFPVSEVIFIMPLNPLQKLTLKRKAYINEIKKQWLDGQTDTNTGGNNTESLKVL